MELRCKIEREGGTVVKIGNTDYHFLPNANGDHVCFVSDKAHVSRFLAVPEGYEQYSNLEAVESGGASPPIIVERPPEVEAPAKGPDYNGLTRKQLEKAFEEKFKKKPHPRAKDSTLLEALTGG